VSLERLQPWPAATRAGHNKGRNYSQPQPRLAATKAVINISWYQDVGEGWLDEKRWEMLYNLLTLKMLFVLEGKLMLMKRVERISEMMIGVGD